MCRSGAGSWVAVTRPGMRRHACFASRRWATGPASSAQCKPSLFRADPDPASALGLPHRDEGNLFACRGFLVEAVLQAGARRKDALEERAIERLHPVCVLYVADIDGGRNDIGEIHVGLLQIVQQI